MGSQPRLELSRVDEESAEQNCVEAHNCEEGVLAFCRLHEYLAGVLAISEIDKTLHSVNDAWQHFFGDACPNLPGQDLIKQNLKNAADKCI